MKSNKNSEMQQSIKKQTMYSHAWLNNGICSVKCTIGQFYHCMNTTEYMYTNLDSTVYYTPRLHGIPSLYMWSILDRNVVM